MTALQHTARALPLASLVRALWGLSVGLFCSSCGSDDDLATGYLGDTPDDPPTADVRELTDSWWCLGQPPPLLREPRPPTQPVGFVLPVVDWTTLQPLAGRGLVASLCPSTLFDCALPIAQLEVREGMLGTTPLPAGVAGVIVIEGFDGFIEFQIMTPPGTPEAQLFIPVNYYLGGPISGDITQGPPVYMLPRSAWSTVLQQSFPLLDRERVQAAGTLIAGVFDCNGDPVQDARVEIVGPAAGGLTPFLLPGSRIPIAQPVGSVITGESGLLGYLNVPPGAVQLRAFRRDDTQPFATAEVGVVPREMSMASLRPAYVNDANLSATPPPCCDSPARGPAPLEP